VGELVNSLKIILENELFAQQMANNLYDDVNENYTVGKVIPEYIKLYNSLNC
jgi:glycosyltransferase involved in cell wall biosynthesis